MKKRQVVSIILEDLSKSPVAPTFSIRETRKTPEEGLLLTCTGWLWWVTKSTKNNETTSECYQNYSIVYIRKRVRFESRSSHRVVGRPAYLSIHIVLSLVCLLVWPTQDLVWWAEVDGEENARANFRPTSQTISVVNSIGPPPIKRTQYTG